MQKHRQTLTPAILLIAPFAFAEPEVVPLEMFTTEDSNLEVTLWAQTPMFNNPTNMDIDKDGRIWVAEGVNYRRHGSRRPEGDRIVVLQDTNGDGQADKNHVFVQEKFLTAPLGVAVLDNKIVVSMTPSMIVYTDVDRDLVFDPSKGDTREELLTGFNSKQHDHSLHSVTAGPDGQWYWNHGNCGAQFTDKSGKTFRLGSAYQMQHIAGKKSGLTEGQSIHFEITGAVAKDIFVEVEGKARETDFIAKPTATVHCDSLAFMNQACGRINPEVPISEGLLHWSGDETLGSHAARNLRFTM